jgi:hypothetical protein
MQASVLRNVFACCCATFLAALAWGGTPHAPLPQALMTAKTVYIQGDASAVDHCYAELTKWGRFRIVTDQKEADVTFQIESHIRTSGYHGQVDDSGDVNVNAQNTKLVTLSVLDSSGKALWSDTQPHDSPMGGLGLGAWGNVLSHRISALVKDLRKRMEEQTRQ